MVGRQLGDDVVEGILRLILDFWVFTTWIAVLKEFDALSSIYGCFVLYTSWVDSSLLHVGFIPSTFICQYL